MFAFFHTRTMPKSRQPSKGKVWGHLVPEKEPLKRCVNDKGV
jgi:hypothetical protein